MNRPSLRHAVSPVLMALLAAGVIVTGQASALSLGALNASSKLGEPLRARLLLDGVANEHDGLQVTVTGRDNVRGAAIAWTSKVETGANGRTYLVISSAERIEDPALSLRIVVRTADGAETSKDQTLLLSPEGPSQAVPSNTTVAGKVAPMLAPTPLAAPVTASVTSPSGDAVQRPVAPMGAINDPAPAVREDEVPAPPRHRKKVVHPTAVPVPTALRAPEPVIAATAGSDATVKELNVQLLNTMVRQAELQASQAQLQAEQLRLIQKIQDANATASAAIARQTPAAVVTPPVTPVPMPAAAPTPVPVPVPMASAPARPSVRPSVAPPSPLVQPTVAVATNAPASGAATSAPVPVAIPPVVASVPLAALPKTVPTSAMTDSLPASGTVVPAVSPELASLPAASGSPVAQAAVASDATAVPASAASASETSGAVVTGASAPRPASRPHPIRPMTPGVVHDEAPASAGLFGLGVNPLAAAGAALAVLLGLLVVAKRRRKTPTVTDGHLDDYVGPEVEHAAHDAAHPIEPSMEVIDFGNPPDLRIPPDPSEPSEEPGHRRGA